MQRQVYRLFLQSLSPIFHIFFKKMSLKAVFLFFCILVAMAASQNKKRAYDNANTDARQMTDKCLSYKLQLW